MSDERVKIGDAAAAIDVPTNVLRHWEAVGLLRPPRSPSGHRTYDEQTINQARLIQVLQRTGLSLREIRQLAIGKRDARQRLIRSKRTQLQEHIALLRAADRYLAHVVTCRHPIISECPECSSFSASGRRP